MAFLTMEVSRRHARTCEVIRDAVLPANHPDLSGADMSRDVARVVSDVSVLCPAVVAHFGYMPSRLDGRADPVSSPR
jgi:hypothetical protein